MAKKSATVGKAGNSQGPKVKISGSPFKDAIFDSWGGMKSPKPVSNNKGGKK